MPGASKWGQILFSNAFLPVLLEGNGDADRIRVLTVSAMQRAGLGALVPSSAMSGVTEKRGQLQPGRSQSPVASVPSGLSGPTPEPPTRREPSPAITATSRAAPQSAAAATAADNDHSRPANSSSRWGRRQREERGWQVVPKRTPEYTQELVSEWSAPVLDELQLGKSGVALALTQDSLHRQALSMRGNPEVTALVSPIKSDPPKNLIWRMTRTTYHTQTTMQKNGKDHTYAASRVGYLYQLHATQDISLNNKPVISKAGQASSTTVLKIVAHKRFTENNLWEKLLQGHLRTFSDALRQDARTKKIPDNAIQDTFQLQMSGRMISALVRVRSEYVEALLALSGITSWYFIQPLGAQAEAYPVTWAVGTLPDDISVIQKRAKAAGSLGICVADRRVGYRAKASELAEVKRKLGHEDFVTWKLAGAPLSCSVGEAESWLLELKAEGKVLEPHQARAPWHTRMAYSDSFRSYPRNLTLSSVTQGSREYLLTLARMPPRQGPPLGTRQWTGANRWTRPATSDETTMPKPTPPRTTPAPAAHSEPSIPRPPAPASVTEKSEIASLTELVRHMHQALLQSGILKEEPPKSQNDSTMDVGLRTKRAAEQQLTPAAAAVADE